MGTTALNLQWVVCALTQQTINMNKFLAIACLATVATAAPEADADAYYSTYGYGLGHYGYGLGAYGYAGYPYAHHGYAHHAYAAPVATGYAHVSPSASLNIAGLAKRCRPRHCWRICWCWQICRQLCRSCPRCQEIRRRR